jgi:hypothetical protein
MFGDKFKFLMEYDPSRGGRYAGPSGLLSEEEKNLIRMVEERHMGSFQFAAQIDKIVYTVTDWFQSVRDNTYPMEEVVNGKTIRSHEYKEVFYQHELPEFPFIANCYLYVKVTDFEELRVDRIWRDGINGAQVSVGGQYDEIKDNKLQFAEITCRIVSVAGVLHLSSFTSDLYHEVTHMYENYKRLVNSNRNLTAEKFHEHYKAIQLSLDSSNRYVSIFAWLVYHFLFESEASANISSVYSDLQSLDSTSFQDDMIDTTAGEMYLNGRQKDLPVLERAPLKEWQRELGALAGRFVRGKTPEEIREKTLKLLNQYLDRFFRRMCSAASLYYQDLDASLHY